MSRAIQVVWKTSALSSSGALAVDDGGVPFVLDLHIPIPRNDGLVEFIHIYLVGGIPTPLKNDGQLVRWDDEIPMESHNPNVPNHQSDK